MMKASFKAILKSPSAIFFSIAFPLIFIVAFGFMSDKGVKVQIAFTKNCDTNNSIYQSLLKVPVVKVYKENDSIKSTEDFKKGNIAALLDIQKQNDSALAPYKIDFRTSIAAGNDKEIAKQILNSVITEINQRQFPQNKNYAIIKEALPIEGRPFRYLDFFLPGMLGFSMLSAGIFGTAFVFFNLRQTLVLKRFYATPIKRINIIIAEGFSRLAMQLFASAIIISVGYFAFNFTLIHGFSTFLFMLMYCLFGLVIFLGMGFIISSLAKNEALIPPLANMITMPQLLLSGVFVSTSNFPDWLQPVCNILPLTQLNNTLRNIAFQGGSWHELWKPSGILFLWGILVYAIAVKVFRWE